ncbi:hypothetical protein BCO18430_02263 [Burkholderia contaminans]|uniref:hypothetical protein n=1 Tax=Burkholderia contaminans TaxID=488447 RepID=UPI0014539AA0|nr:hypothetical protein [Burkholderia contaminans]VWC75907.1 hypothetical protein BCO18430_02263 [Burkholderia contaminans]
MLVGKKDVVAFRIEPPDSSEVMLRNVSIFMDGIEFTKRDSLVYVPSYLFSLRNEIPRLYESHRIENYCEELADGSATEVHAWLTDESPSAVKDKAIRELLCLNLGETTLNLLSFFIALRSGTWLTCQSFNPDSDNLIHAVRIDADDLAEIFATAADTLERDYSAPRRPAGHSRHD